MPDSPKLLLTADEACAALGVCRKTLYSLSAPRGPIATVKIGKSGVRWSVSTLESWISQQEVEGKAQ